MTEVMGGLERQRENPLRTRRERHRRRAEVLTPADHRDDARSDVLRCDVERLRQPRDRALVASDQAKQYVLAPDVAMTELYGLLLRHDNRLTTALRKSLEHLFPS